MAYKFQLGAAILSGSIKAEDGLVATDVDDATAANVVAQIDNGEIPIAKLAAKTISGKDLGSNLDALSVDDSSIEFSAGGAFNGSAASAIRVKASGITNAMLAGSIANAKLSNSTISGKALGSNLDALSVEANKGLSMSSYNGSAAVANLKVVLDPQGGLEFASGAPDIRLKAAVAGSGLAHSSGVLSVDLGEFSTEQVANGDFFAFIDADDGSMKKEAIADLATLFAGAGLGAASSVLSVQVSGAVKVASDKVGLSGSIAGDGLAYLGGVDSIRQLAVNVDGTGIEISGDALRLKDNGVTLAKMAGIARGKIIVGDASGDPAALALGAANTVLSSDGSDAVYSAVTNAMLAGSIADSKLNKLSSANKVDLSALDLDGGTDIGAALVDADLLIVDDGAGGTNRKSTMGRVATYAKSKFSAATTGGKAEGSLQYNDGAYTFTQMSVAELRAHLSVADSNSMDFAYASGQISADLRLKSGNALEIDGSGLDLKGTIGGNRTFSGDVVISGGLTVNGTQTILNTATLEVEDKNIYIAKGSADSSAADGAGLTIEMGSDDLTLNWSHAAQQMQLKKGAAFASIRAETFVGNLNGAVSQTINAIGDAAGNLVVGFNYGSADTTASRTWTLPASPGIGQIVHVKAPSAVHSSGITILKSGSQTIDGVASIVLESPYAAVNLMYVANNTWRVF